ncbi:MAG: hypothetical protein IKZ89_09365 [Bacteroidaceae bacterium]|nr:hypothetical protein [Bacteroidaceae bacterium]
MRIVSIVFSLLLAITPAIVSAQEQPNDNLVENGVFLPELLRSNPKVSIFYNALVATHLKDTLEQYIDPNYPEIEYEWTVQALRDHYSGVHAYSSAYETDYIAYPERREFKYTFFVVTDSVLSSYGIRNLDDLRDYAKSVYPEGAGLEDVDRASSLNKLLSYHILPFWLPYDQFNTSQTRIIKNRKYLDEFDVEDFFETLLPHSVMRISTPYEVSEKPLGIFINRKGTIKTGLEAEGILISKDYNSCINGGYYYIEKPLLYDSQTRNNILNTRMRIMACTLSPDFINSGARGRLNGDPANGGNQYLNRMVYSFRPGFCKNIEWNDGPINFFVRYRDASFGTYYGDELSIIGPFDIIFRLPAVPSDGLYEIRIWNNSMAWSSWNPRGTVLFYTRNEDGDFVPCGTPVDCHLSLEDPLIGGVRDDNYGYDVSESQKQDSIYANDKLLHKRGYLKAPDSYGTSSPLRDDMGCYRKIISEQYMKSDKDYYLRLRQVGMDEAVFAFNFIEIVPYSVYSGENGPEDKH